MGNLSWGLEVALVLDFLVWCQGTIQVSIRKERYSFSPLDVSINLIMCFI